MSKTYSTMRTIFIYIIAVLGSLFSLQGQSAAELEHLFAQLDLSQLPTGYLMDKSGHSSVLDKPMPIEVGVARYSALHDRFARSKVNNTNISFTQPKILEAAIADANTPGTPLPVSILLHEYDRIKPDAADNNLLTVSNGRQYSNIRQIAIATRNNSTKPGKTKLPNSQKTQ